MADEVLEVGARVDSSGVVSGMQQAATATATGTAQMQQSFAATATATGALAQAITQLSATLTANGQAAQQSTTGQRQAAQASTQAAQAARQNSIEQRRQYEEYRKLGESSHAAVSGVQATSAAIRSIEGNAGLRAVENFISKTLGLGPAMQAIFPLVGAFAFGKILFDIGEKAWEVRTKALDAATQMNSAFEALHERAAVTNDDLRITSDRLQMAINKLEGHPSNGAYLALDEARKMADQLAVSLRTDEKELADLLKEHDVSPLGEALSGVAGTGTQHKEMLQDQKNLTNAIAEANRAFREQTDNSSDEKAIKAAGERRDQAIRTAYQTQIDSYHREAIRLQQESSNAQALVMGGVRGAQSIDNSDKIAGIQGRAQQLTDALSNENLQVKIAGQTARKEQDEQAKEQAEQAKRAAAEARSAARQAAAEARAALQEKMRGYEAELSAMKLAGDVSARAEFDYWEGKRAAFAYGSQQYNEVVKRQVAIGEAGARRAHELIEKSKAEQKKESGEIVPAKLTDDSGLDKLFGKLQGDLLMTSAAWDQYWAACAKGEEVQARNVEEMQLIGIHADEAAGRISHLGALEQEAGIRAAEHTRNIAALNAELAKLLAQSQTTILGNISDPKLAAKIQGVRNEISGEQGASNRDNAKDQAAIAQQKAAPLQAATQQVSAGLAGALSSWERGQGTFLQSWGKTMSSMASQLQTHLLQMGAMWIMHYAQQRIAHLATNTAKTVSDTATAATSVATSKAAATQQGTTAAIAAFKNTYASVSAIPIIGPALAPVAAAGAFVAVEAFSAQGGMESVPADNTLMNLHKNEMVLPAHLADGIRKMTGGGDTITNHFGGNTYGGDDRSFRDKLDDHEDHLAGMYSKMQRDRKV